MTRWLQIQLTGPIKDRLPVHPGEVERVQARAAAPAKPLRDVPFYALIDEYPALRTTNPGGSWQLSFEAPVGLFQTPFPCNRRSIPGLWRCSPPLESCRLFPPLRTWESLVRSSQAVTG